jgi:hemerythrin-like metal-binding protein
MRLFKWSAAHAVHLPEIDAEHRAIYQSAGELHEAIAGNASSERIIEILHGLIAVVEDHFAHEERLMQASDYTSYKWHKQQHDAARKRIREFTVRIEAGEMEAAPILLEHLAGWLRDHTSVADRMMGAYLRNYQRAHAA